MSGITIRPAGKDDVRAIADIYNHYIRTSTATFDTEEKSYADRVEWLAEHDDRHPVFVAESGGVVIAWGALTRYGSRRAWNGTAEVAVYVDADHVAQGIGPQMLEHLIEAAREVGLHALVTQIVSENTGSLKMTSRAGFRDVGTLREVGRKFDRWLDVVVKELLVEDLGAGSVAYQKFDVAKLERLNDPGRLESIRPDVLWDVLALAEPSTIIEIGAGTGLFASAFAERAPGATVYAADTEPAMLEWMRAHRPEVATGRIVPVASSESGVPLDDGVADAVVMINVHHELARPDAIYAEAARLLHAGGRILVVDWAARETPKGPPARLRATPETLASFLRRAGFADVVVRDDTLPWHTVAVATKP